MGCSGSKPTGGECVDPSDVNVSDKPADLPAPVPDRKNSTKSGFNSDIQDKSKNVKSFSEVLVQRNEHNVSDIYDVDDAAVLGRGACGSVCIVKKKSTNEVYAMKTVPMDGMGGAGACGSVCIVKKKSTNEVYAMKTVPMDGMGGATLDELRREIEVQKALDHPNIVRVFEYFEERHQMHIIMELCKGGALVSRMKNHRHGYGEQAAATLVQKMLSAVLYCHHKGVVHRDIKLDNFIYENEAEDAELKLIDFGFACEVKPGYEAMWDQIGTPSYMAPELWADHCKEYDSSVDMWAMGVVAYMLLSGKRHPNIVRVFEYFEERHQMHIIMELCKGGALVSRMKNHRHGYGEQAAATLVQKMLSAVLYCHHKGVVHRDIKLDNFIYENEAEDAELKLIDFGFACEVKPGYEAMWDQIGTPSYMAPELWADHCKEYDSSVDMWAMGVVAYMLLSGKRPFHHTDRKEKARMIKQDPVRFVGSEWDKISPEAKDFCSRLMNKEPHKRLSASKALEHPWIKSASTLHTGVDPSEQMSSHLEVVDSLQEFARAEDVKKVALEVIAFSTPPNKVEELRDLFVTIDKDNSGTISRQEFAKAMTGQPGVPDSAASDSLFNAIDVNASGEIEYMEFLGATTSLNKGSSSKPTLLSAFSALDRDNNGFITKDELQAVFVDKYSEEDLNRMITSAGGESGNISFQQFKGMMLRDMSSDVSVSGGEKSRSVQKFNELAMSRFTDS
eukprot:CAMPEP_0119343668 /NCGR_PEP_ID=MMETSP1333-20130426/106570_1 /TAXON_ID=418940 /ORGANISM="Scyphosphaera apsteinii, Strain RCC1455" /LENGTH=730 /DNA_ID=CAMNT_0007356073 /DNA_START=45 /DNA_END=2237 /DNA_ORIENTATION=+